MQARALGMLRDVGGVHAALQVADRARSAVTVGDDPAGMMSFPVGKQAYHTSSAMLWLGPSAADDAEAAAVEAVNHFESDPVEERRLGELTLARVDLVSARLIRGDVDDMLPDLREAAQVLHQRPIESVTRRLRQLDATLARPAVCRQLCCGRGPR